MKIILPVAGASNRFPGMKPKWLLTHPNGNLMFHEGVTGLDLSSVTEIVVVCRRDHVERFNAEDVIRRQMEASPIGLPWRIAVIEPTRSQPETVAAGLRQLGIEGPILIKDSDNRFSYMASPGNSVAVLNLRDSEPVAAAGKSYVELDDHDRVINIVEKRVISDTFCVGGYSFAEAGEFLEAFDAIRNVDDIYVSHVIYEMISRGTVFKAVPVDAFIDWGTLKDWERFKKTYATLFVDLDGTVVKSSARWFDPVWGTSDAIPGAVEALNALQTRGRVQVIVTTSRTEDFRHATEEQLKRIGLKCDRVIYGLAHARRIAINDYAATNPYPSAEAINVPRDRGGLDLMLRGFFEDLA